MRKESGSWLFLRIQRNSASVWADRLGQNVHDGIRFHTRCQGGGARNHTESHQAHLSGGAEAQI